MSSQIDTAEFRDRLGSVEVYDIGRIRRLDAQRYARAIEDDNPLFHDVEYARDRGYDDIVVPPTYPTSIIEKDEGVPGDDLREDGVDPKFFPIPIPDTGVLMGGGQELRIDRHIVADEYVVIEKEFSGLHQKESEALGTLTFIEFAGEYFVEGEKRRERAINCDETFILGDRR